MRELRHGFNITFYSCKKCIAWEQGRSSAIRIARRLPSSEFCASATVMVCQGDCNFQMSNENEDGIDGGM